jgi:uncharacterized damage-inducible protein DinB
MTFADALLAEFDHEMDNTRRTLERVPDDRLGWRPHARSWTLGELATHLAGLLDWAQAALERDAVDLAGPDAPPRRQAATSRAQLLEGFDRSRAAVRAALAATDDARLGEPWTLRAGGRMIFTLSRLAVLRNMVMNHGIHHRGQLGVYLRLVDVPVPALYGSSADESAHQEAAARHPS